MNEQLPLKRAVRQQKKSAKDMQFRQSAQDFSADNVSGLFLEEVNNAIILVREIIVQVSSNIGIMFVIKLGRICFQKPEV